MLELFHAISQLGDHIDYWDLARQPGGGVLLRAKSRVTYASEHAATEIARGLAARIEALGHDVRDVRTATRAGAESEPGWHAFIEILVG